MTRTPACGQPALWRAAAALRAEGADCTAIEARLSAEIGRPVGRRTVYRLLEYARYREGRRDLRLLLTSRQAACAAAAARARGWTIEGLSGRLLALLFEDADLLDAVLDDGVATPREERT